MRILQSILIWAFFAVMMVFLTRDHLIPLWQHGDSIPVSTAVIANQWHDREEWMRLRFQGQPIGIMHTLSLQEDSAYISSVRMLLKGPFLSGEIAAIARTDENLDLERVWARFHFPSLGIEDLELAGAVEGKELLLRLASSGGVKYLVQPLRNPITMNSAADPFLRGGEMEPAESYSMEVFDPIWGVSTGRLSMRLMDRQVIHVGQENVSAKRIVAELGFARMQIWVDDEGRQLRREISIAGSEATVGDRPASDYSILMDIVEPSVAMAEMPELREPVQMPEFTAAELRGTDSGHPVSTFGFLPLLMKFAQNQIPAGNNAASRSGSN